MVKKTRKEICQAAVRDVFGGQHDVNNISQSLVESALDRVELKVGGRIDSLTEHEIKVLATTAAWFALDNNFHLSPSDAPVSSVREYIADHVYTKHRGRIECAAAKSELQTVE